MDPQTIERAIKRCIDISVRLGALEDEVPPAAGRRIRSRAPDQILIASSRRARVLPGRSLPSVNVRSVVFSAGPKMAGRTLPAMANLLAANGAVSPARAAAPAEDPRSGLTR